MPQKDAFDIEVELCTAYNRLRTKAPELALDLMEEFRATSQNPNLQYPSDAPSQYHYAFKCSIDACLSDLDFD